MLEVGSLNQEESRILIGDGAAHPKEKGG